jgi:hypothetical protein
MYHYSSIPSISIGLFKKHFNIYNVRLSLSLEHDLLIRSSYLGGRCEVFGNPLPQELVFHFDFKNMYGQIMLSKFPVTSFEHVLRPTNIETPGFYKIRVFSNNLYLPILPHMANINERGTLIFSNGEFEG